MYGASSYPKTTTARFFHIGKIELTVFNFPFGFELSQSIVLFFGVKLINTNEIKALIHDRCV